MRRLATFLALLLSPCAALAGGALAFLAAPTTVNSGEPGSFMNRYSDCTTTPCTVDPMTGFAIPMRSGPIAVATQKTATDLVIHFVVPDRTHRGTDTGGNAVPLTLGDRIIVQIDPTTAAAPCSKWGRPRSARTTATSWSSRRARSAARCGASRLRPRAGTCRRIGARTRRSPRCRNRAATRPRAPSRWRRTAPTTRSS